MRARNKLSDDLLPIDLVKSDVGENEKENAQSKRSPIVYAVFQFG